MTAPAFPAERRSIDLHLRRSRRRLRGLEVHLAELGHRGEAVATRHIADELEMAIACLPARIRIVA